MSKFLNSTEVSVNKVGYVVNKKGKPIVNSKFTDEQEWAKLLITLSKEIEGKDFVGKKPDSIEEIKNLTWQKVNSTKVKEYISVESKPKLTVNDKLKKEALDFINYDSKKQHIDKVNKYMTKNFSCTSEFEEFGLLFEKGTSKLDKIYTIDEILVAVDKVIDYI